MNMPLFFDAVIFGFLFLDIVFIILLWKRGQQFLSRFTNDLLILMAIIAFGVISFGSFVEPQLITVRHQHVEITPNPSRVLHAILISDTHVGPYKGERFFKRVVDTITEIHPDLILVAGDFTESKSEQISNLSPLANLTAVYPTYAVLGNHDYRLGMDTDPVDEENAAEIERVLLEYGVQLLKNEGILLDEKRLWIAGTDELWTGQADIQAALARRPLLETPTILISHNPDIVREISPAQHIELVVAGHTHGGQIRLPLIGPVPPIPDQLGRAYDRGLFDYKGSKLFITSGIGESGPRARLFNPPEIVVLTIQY